jgi:hypothetical protein
MEQVAAKTTNAREGLSKPPDAQWREEVIRRLTACSLHFRTEIDDGQMEIYLGGLRDCDSWRIARAFERCIKECEFMPKLRDLFDKMPEAERKENPLDYGRILKEWRTPLGQGTVAHYFETENGGTVCRVEKA